MGRIVASLWAACLLMAALLSCTPEGERYLCNYRVAEISTTDSTVLAGFAARNGLSDGVHRDLMSHCLVLKKEGEKICIISNDLMEVGTETADEIRKAISEQSGLPMDHILMHCIHTHSAPRTGGWCAKEGQPNYAYAQKVRRVVVENAVAAITDDAAFRPFEMEFGQGQSDINYNRCDKEGFCNKDAYVLRLVDPKTRKPMVSMVNYSCHPVSLGPGSYKVSTDFPGFSCDSLSKAWGGEVVHFTSASGNADPSYGIKKDVEAAERNGWQLATDLKGISFRKIPFDGHFDLKTSRIDLPYRADTITVDLIRKHVAEVTQWKNTVSASWVDDVNYWAKYTIEDIEAGLVENTLPFYVEAVNLGGVILFFTQGEPFMEYQVALRERFPDTPLLFIAYTNGQNSYLPSKTAFEDTSGKYDYEVKQMHVYIGAPYPLSERMPDVYLDGITDIVKEALDQQDGEGLITSGIPGLLPQPESVDVRKGTFRLRPSTTVVAEDTAFSGVVRYLTDRVALRTAETLPGKNYLQIRRMDIIPKEGYVLEVDPHGITIDCSAPNGAFYALQTLFQLMPDAVYAGRFSGRADIPCCRIVDAPRFAYRGLHLDVCSHFFDVAFIKKYLDELAMHKFNVFHWHLTEDQGWRIEIKKYPRLTEEGSVRPYTVVGDLHSPINDGTPYGGYYTQDEILEIVQYAAERFITVLPEIEMPGHARAAITCFPELSCFPEEEHSLATKWGVFRDVYCPREETFAFLEDVLTEVMDLFPSPLIHIGGDECPKYNWQRSDFCQQLMRREGLKNEEELQSWFIRRIERFINSKGRNIIGWDEILQGGLAPNAAVMSWLGEQGGIAAARQHHNVVMCPYQRYYLDYYQVDPTEDAISMGHLVPLKVVYDYEPVPAVLTEEEQQYIIGVEGTVWTEYIKTPSRAEYMAFPRALAIAEAGWTRGHAKDFDGFTKRMERHFARLEAAGVNYCRNWNVTAYQDETYGTAF